MVKKQNRFERIMGVDFALDFQDSCDARFVRYVRK